MLKESIILKIMPYKLLFHHNISDDLSKISHDIRRRILKAIQNKVLIFPDKYGKPLRKPLAGYWKLRVGDFRIVYKITKSEIWILAIMHRKEIYEYIIKNRL